MLQEEVLWKTPMKKMDSEKEISGEEEYCRIAAVAPVCK